MQLLGRPRYSLVALIPLRRMFPTPELRVGV